MEKHISLVRAGETLSENVMDPVGRLLFPKGANLTDKVIAALRQRGVEVVAVEGPQASMNPALLERARANALKYYVGHDLSIPPGPVLLGLRVEAEARRLESGRPAILRECSAPGDAGPTPSDLPALCLDGFSPPELPAVALELNHMLSSPEPSSAAVAEVIGRSPGLAARLLRLVNSPLYGFPGKIESLPRAVTMIGLREVGMLASGMVIIEQFGVIPRSVVDMRSFLEHSLGCALAARALAEATGVVSGETAFTAGLLHDIGRLYFFTAFPERSRFCIDSALKHSRALYQEETLFFGKDHAAMGGQLLQEWGMPPSLCAGASAHHDVGTAPGEPLPPLIHMADLLVHAMGVGCSGECGPPEMCPEIGSLLPVHPEELADIAAGIESRLEAIVAAFR